MKLKTMTLPVVALMITACQATAQKKENTAQTTQEKSFAEKMAAIEKATEAEYQAFEQAMTAYRGAMESGDNAKVAALELQCQNLYARYFHVKDSLMHAEVAGTPFIELEMNDLEGKAVKLSQWVGKGNYTLVDFWASWCGPCCQEMPNVVKYYEKYHEKGFNVVGVSLDSKAAAWKSAVERLGMKWPQMSDLMGWQSAATKAYGIHSIPFTLLVDGEGHIVDMNLRGEQLGERLAKIYGF